jgi:hypothetical protein
LLESVSGVVEVVCAREYSGGVVTCEEESARRAAADWGGVEEGCNL